MCKPKRWVINKRDASGRNLDLHALRHTHGTRLVASGADIKTVQALMRHSTPGMTLGIYVHKDWGRMADAVAGLPEINPAKHELAQPAESVARTGTDDRDEDDDDPSNGGPKGPPTRGQQGSTVGGGKVIYLQEVRSGMPAGLGPGGRRFKSCRPDQFLKQALPRERRRAFLLSGLELRRSKKSSNR